MENKELERRFPKTFAAVQKADMAKGKDVNAKEIHQRMMRLTPPGRASFLRAFFMGFGVGLFMDDEGLQFPESKMDFELDEIMAKAVTDMSENIQLVLAIPLTDEGVRQDVVAVQSVDDFSAGQARAADADFGVGLDEEKPR